MSGRAYTAQERADAVALALSQGVTIAAKQSGVERHTLSRWLAAATSEDSTAIGAVIVADTREAVAARIWSVFVAGIDALAERVKDPKTRAGDLARIVDVLGERYALLAGGPTANVNVNTMEGAVHEIVESMTWEEKDALAASLHDAARQRMAAEAAGTLAALTTDPLAVDKQDILALITAIEERIGREP
jgi:hypothetical protein